MANRSIRPESPSPIPIVLPSCNRQSEASARVCRTTPWSLKVHDKGLNGMCNNNGFYGVAKGLSGFPWSRRSGILPAVHRARSAAASREGPHSIEDRGRQADHWNGHSSAIIRQGLRVSRSIFRSKRARSQRVRTCPWQGNASVNKSHAHISKFAFKFPLETQYLKKLASRLHAKASRKAPGRRGGRTHARPTDRSEKNASAAAARTRARATLSSAGGARRSGSQPGPP